jgi:ABC-type polar amino acid transport system ATPase subunit
VMTAPAIAQEDALISVRGWSRTDRSSRSITSTWISGLAIVVAIGPSGSASRRSSAALTASREIDRKHDPLRRPRNPAQCAPSVGQARQRIGMVFQDYTLFPT